MVTLSPEATHGGLPYVAVFMNARDSLAGELGSQGSDCASPRLELEFSSSLGLKAQMHRTLLLKTFGVSLQPRMVLGSSNLQSARLSGLGDSVMGEDIRVAIQALVRCG